MRCRLGVDGAALGDVCACASAPLKMNMSPVGFWLFQFSWSSSQMSSSSSSSLPTSSSSALLLLFKPRGGGARFLILYRGSSVWSKALVGLASRRLSRGRMGFGILASGGEGRWLWADPGVAGAMRLCKLRHELIRFPIAVWADI